MVKKKYFKINLLLIKRVKQSIVENNIIENKTIESNEIEDITTDPILLENNISENNFINNRKIILIKKIKKDKKTNLIQKSNKPIVNKPIVNKPTVNKPTVNKPIVNKPIVNKPIVNNPINNKPVNNKPINKQVSKPIVSNKKLISTIKLQNNNKKQQKVNSKIINQISNVKKNNELILKLPSVPPPIIPTNNPLIIGVCLRVKNDQKFIKDWVNHYLKLEFDYIYIYDNLSSPSVVESLKDYDENRVIIKNDLVIKSNQKGVYQDCIDNNKHLDWLLICDSDEFLYLKDIKVKDFLNNYSIDTGTILINWLVFGNGGKYVYDYSKSIFEQFTKREPYDFYYNIYVKSFIRIKYINKINSWHKIFNSDYFIKDIYHNIVDNKITNKNLDTKLSDDTPILLIHYMTIDVESMVIKRERNSKFDIAVNNSDKYTIEWYLNNFKDEIIDERMLVYK